MRWPHVNLWLPALIVAVALPGTSAYLYYHATRDPTLRPLGVTQEELAVTEGAKTGFASINVRIDWGRDAPLAMSRDEVRAALSRTLNVFASDYWFTFSDTPGRSVSVTYVVGGNRIGPYPITDTAEGIRTAVSALQMARRSGP